MISYLSTGQLKNLSSFLLDFAKIMIGSIIIGFFVPGSSGQVNLEIFIGGVIVAAASFLSGIKLTPAKL